MQITMSILFSSGFDIFLFLRRLWGESFDDFG